MGFDPQQVQGDSVSRVRARVLEEGLGGRAAQQQGVNQQMDLIHQASPQQHAVEDAAAIHTHGVDAVPGSQNGERLPEVNLILPCHNDVNPFALKVVEMLLRGAGCAQGDEVFP